jgi:hypothetical protein
LISVQVTAAGIQFTGLVREPVSFPHKSCIFSGLSLTKMLFYKEIVQKLKFPNNSTIETLYLSQEVIYD